MSYHRCKSVNHWEITILSYRSHLCSRLSYSPDTFPEKHALRVRSVKVPTSAGRVREQNTIKMATDGEEDVQPSLEKLGLDDSPRSPTILPWDRFSNWLHCACVVTFDLELGQAMEVRFDMICVHDVYSFLSLQFPNMTIDS